MIHPLKLVLIFVFSTPIVAFSQRESSTSTLKLMQDERADLYFIKGELFVKKHNFQNAFQNLSKARLLAETGQDWNLYIKSLNVLASINHSLSKDQQVEIFNWIKKSFKLLTDDITNRELAELHLHTANFYINLTYEADTTLYHCKEALRIWIPLMGELNESVASCYHLMGDVYKFWNNDFLQAEHCYEKALQIREKIQFSNESVLARNYYGLAVTNRSQGDFEKALSYGIKTLELSKKMNNMLYVEMTSYIVGNIYRDMGKSSLAKEYYLRAIALNKLGNNPDDLAFYYMGLGETLKNEMLPDEAIAYFKKALSHSNSDKMQGIHLLYMMGETYLIKKDYSKSLQAFNEQLKELKKLNLMRSRLAYHGFAGLGDYHFSIGGIL